MEDEISLADMTLTDVPKVYDIYRQQVSVVDPDFGLVVPEWAYTEKQLYQWQKKPTWNNQVVLRGDRLVGGLVFVVKKTELLCKLLTCPHVHHRELMRLLIFSAEMQQVPLVMNVPDRPGFEEQLKVGQSLGMAVELVPNFFKKGLVDAWRLSLRTESTLIRGSQL